MSEERKAEIIKKAMRSIGTKRVSALDGMTIFIDDICYNIYVNGNEVEVMEI